MMGYIFFLLLFKMTLTNFLPIPGPAQLFWTGSGISFLFLLPTVSAKQAPLPGQLLFSWTGPVQNILPLWKAIFLGSIHPLPHCLYCILWSNIISYISYSGITPFPILPTVAPHHCLYCIQWSYTISYISNICLIFVYLAYSDPTPFPIFLTMALCHCIYGIQ